MPAGKLTGWQFRVCSPLCRGWPTVCPSAGVFRRLLMRFIWKGDSLSSIGYECNSSYSHPAVEQRIGAEQGSLNPRVPFAWMQSRWATPRERGMKRAGDRHGEDIRAGANRGALHSGTIAAGRAVSCPESSEMIPQIAPPPLSLSYLPLMAMGHYCFLFQWGSKA